MSIVMASLTCNTAERRLRLKNVDLTYSFCPFSRCHLNLKVIFCNLGKILRKIRKLSLSVIINPGVFLLQLFFPSISTPSSKLNYF
jgi:hypothetical protein